MTLPKILTDLDKLAEANGWLVVNAHNEDLPDLSFTLEEIQHSYMREIDDDFDFGFSVTFARLKDTNRWNALRVDRDYPVAGMLFYQEVMIDDWYWKTLNSLRYWLANPNDLFERGIDLPNKAQAAFQAVIKTAFNPVIKTAFK